MNDDMLRSRIFSNKIRKRDDLLQRRLIDGFSEKVEFTPFHDLMISPFAWERVLSLEVEPKLVFAHPDILVAHPTTSLYYRGLALLSRKRVQQLATNVTTWEAEGRDVTVNPDSAKQVACLYNTMISSVIEGATDWTLDNGYRNILATMGITLDGSFRNTIGTMAEKLVKEKIVSWLKANQVIEEDAPEIGKFSLPNNISMNFGSEPDIDFVKGDKSIATIEIKGGRDPAGALERLGAMTKSFAETPSACTNFLVAGVITSAMRHRLDEIGVVKVYLLDDISRGGDLWDEFINELFHHTLRVI